MAKLEPKIYDDFSGGINQSTSEDNIADNEVVDALNMNIDVDRSLFSRQGLQQYNSTLTGASRVTSIYFSKKSDNTNPTLIVTTLAKVYKDNGVGGWTDITGGTAPPSNTLWTWRTLNNLAIGVNGTSVPQKYNLSTLPATLADLAGSPADKCAHIEIYQGRTILSNDTDEPTSIHGSAPNNSEDWTTAGTTFTIYVDKDNGHRVIGTAKFFDDLIIFKRKGVYRLVNPDNTPANMQIVQLFDNVGCVSQHTIKQIGNELTWWDDDGQYALRATQESGDVAYSAISKKIQPFVDDINDALLNEAVAVDVRALNQYRVAIPPSGATTNSRVLVRDYFHGAWTRHESTIAHASYGVAEFSSVITPMVGGYNGKVYKLDTTEADDGSGFTKQVCTKRHHFGIPQLRKFFHRLYLEWVVTGTYAVAFTVDIDFGKVTKGFSFTKVAGVATWDSSKWDEVSWGGVNKAARDASIGKKGRGLQVKMTNTLASQPVTLIKYSIDASSLSRRGGLD